jgi:hypothetical protein
MLAQPRADSGDHVNYWFFSMTGNFGNKLDDFMMGMDISDRHRSVRFKGRSDQSLIISFEPEQGQCLYVIRPQDETVRVLPSLVKEAAHLSAVSRIDMARTSGDFLGQIGPAYPVDWCTYYERADLARQEGDWTQVGKLWDEAHRKGFKPGVSFEYLPFIEAFVNLGQWDRALGLTLEVKNAPPSARLTMCDYWSELPESPERNDALKQIQAEMNCSSR